MYAYTLHTQCEAVEYSPKSTRGETCGHSLPLTLKFTRVYIYAHTLHTQCEAVEIQSQVYRWRDLWPLTSCSACTHMHTCTLAHKHTQYYSGVHTSTCIQITVCTHTNLTPVASKNMAMMTVLCYSCTTWRHFEGSIYRDRQAHAYIASVIS